MPTIADRPGELPPLRRVCVYCGSSIGARGEYRAAATELGTALATRGLELVYGGGRVGLMGAVADAALAAGGHVIGVIPQALMDRELGHRGIQDLRIVADMHERKLTMATLADAFVALPGGWGTLEELTEMLTWLQLGIHRKPIALLDVAGYFDPLLTFAARMVDERFVREEQRGLLLVETATDALLARLAQATTSATAPVDKWVDRISPPPAA